MVPRSVDEMRKALSEVELFADVIPSEVQNLSRQPGKSFNLTIEYQ